MTMRSLLRWLGGALALFLLLAGLTAYRLHREDRAALDLGRPLGVFGPVPDLVTKHVDLTDTQGAYRLVASSDDDLSSRKVSRESLGDLDVPSGTIVAADPLVQPDRPAFLRKVAPGRYPITLYRAEERVAMAELRFAPGTPVRWQMALVAGQDASTLKADEIFGYPVDAGLGCFMDAEGRKAYLEREETEKARVGANDFNLYDDVIAAPLESSIGNAMLFTPLPDKPNIAIFQSGWGDGFYASYWGLDAEGKPLVLVTDFGLLDTADPVAATTP